MTAKTSLVHALLNPGPAMASGCWDHKPGGNIMGHGRRVRALAAMSVAALVAVGGAGTATADPVSAGKASSFAATLQLGGTDVIPPTPEAAVTAPPFGDDADATAIPIDAAPLAVNGTLIATAAVHQASDLATTLGQPASAQAVAGPYNARAVGEIESLDVLLDESIPGGQLVHAELVTGEAVAVCRAGAVQYSASSEVVNLQISDQDPLSGPLNDLITQITDGLNASPLADIISIEPNVVTVTPTGASVDALVITVLAAAGDPPVGKIRLGHAEVSDVGCAGAGAAPQCSDTADNDGDGKIDALDPGCHSDGNPDNGGSYVPSDNDEADGPQCADHRDNDGDGVSDAEDPGCHTDGNAANPASYDATDNDEANSAVGGASLAKSSAAPLAATGGAVATGLAAALGLGALGMFALRRRLV
jgi:hypothetical protein